MKDLSMTQCGYFKKADTNSIMQEVADIYKLITVIFDGRRTGKLLGMTDFRKHLTGILPVIKV